MTGQRFREYTTRPVEQPEVTVEPDGSIGLFWPNEDLTVLLEPAEATQLAADLQTATLVGAPTAQEVSA